MWWSRWFHHQIQRKFSVAYRFKCSFLDKHLSSGTNQEVSSFVGAGKQTRGEILHLVLGTRDMAVVLLSSQNFPECICEHAHRGRGGDWSGLCLTSEHSRTTPAPSPPTCLLPFLQCFRRHLQDVSQVLGALNLNLGTQLPPPLPGSTRGDQDEDVTGVQAWCCGIHLQTDTTQLETVPLDQHWDQTTVYSPHVSLWYCSIIHTDLNLTSTALVSPAALERIWNKRTSAAFVCPPSLDVPPL